MRHFFSITAIIILFISTTSCGTNQYVGYQLPIIPLTIIIDSDGNATLQLEGRIVLPIGTFFFGAAQQLNLGEAYNERNGVLIVNVNGTASVYDLQGASDNISITLESGYYKKVELRKEGINWYFEAIRISDSSDTVEINLANEHCEPVDFYVDGEIVLSIQPETDESFTISSGYYETTACITNSQSCGDTAESDWTSSTTHRILRGSTCNSSPKENEDTNSSACDKDLQMTNVSPHKPTLKPRAKFTVTMSFYNPNDCDLQNIQFSIGWNNDLGGPSGFSIPIIYSKSYADVTLKLTAPANEGSDYFSFYNSNLTICGGICTPAFIYANVQKE